MPRLVALVGRVGSAAHWGARAQHGRLREALALFERLLRYRAVVEDDGDTPRIPGRYAIAEAIDRIFGAALKQAHAAREAVEQLDVGYEVETQEADETEDEMPVESVRLHELFLESEVRHALQWAINARALSEQSPSSYATVMRWLECEQGAQYARMELACAKEESASAAETRRREREVERHAGRAERAYRRIGRGADAFLMRTPSGHRPESPGPWGFQGIGYPFVPSGFGLEYSPVEWRRIATSMLALGTSCHATPHPSPASRGLARALARWEEIDDAGCAMLVLGHLLNAIADDSREHCSHCFRYRVSLTRCSMHKVSQRRPGPANYLANRVHDEYRSRLTQCLAQLEISHPDPDLLRTLVDAAGNSARFGDASEAVDELAWYVGKPVATALLAAVREYKQVPSRARIETSHAFWQNWFRQRMRDFAHPVLQKQDPVEDDEYDVILRDLVRYRAWLEATTANGARTRRLDDETKREMKRLVAQGISYREIGTRFGFSRTTVMNAVRTESR